MYAASQNYKHRVLVHFESTRSSRPLRAASWTALFTGANALKAVRPRRH